MEQTALENTCIVDQDVEPAQALMRGCHRLPHRLAVACIRPDRLATHAKGANGLRGRLGLRRAS